MANICVECWEKNECIRDKSKMVACPWHHAGHLKMDDQYNARTSKMAQANSLHVALNQMIERGCFE